MTIFRVRILTPPTPRILASIRNRKIFRTYLSVPQMIYQRLKNILEFRSRRNFSTIFQKIKSGKYARTARKRFWVVNDEGKLFPEFWDSTPLLTFYKVGNTFCFCFLIFKFCANLLLLAVIIPKALNKNTTKKPVLLRGIISE